MSETVTSIIKAFAQGEVVVVTDDEDREGEGDLIVAASLCTPEKMAFIIRHTSGIVCAPITAEDARRLRLDPMVAHNDSAHATAFTVSIDYKPGMTTGISAEERTACCRALANPNVGAGDFARPGHVFPLIAKEGGVLLRAGHTEAAVDLCKLAGLPPVGVISELVNDDGTVMKGKQVADFAKAHNLPHVTIDGLIAYRQAREKLIERVSHFETTSLIGPIEAYGYRSPFDEMVHLALVYGDISNGQDVLVRFHAPDIVQDFLQPKSRIHAALERLREEGRGILVILRDGAVGVPVKTLDADAPTIENNRRKQWREVGVGAQILRDLGVTSIRHLTSSATTYKGLSGFGIELIGSVPFEP